MGDSNISRRDFLTGAAAVGAVGALGAGALSSCGSGNGNSGGRSSDYNWPTREYAYPPMLDQVPEGKELKAGLIGCGGRGTGALVNFLKAGGSSVKVVSLGDVFQDKIDSCIKKIKTRTGHEISPENCFVGFDAYEKVIDSGVDVVLLATPPKFRPEQFHAAVNAHKHVFMEKPVAVDPTGIRLVMAAARMAEAFDLKIVVGTQRRHQHKYIELFKACNEENAIGRITGGNIYWNGNRPWHWDRNPGWSEMEWMIRDWVNWCWLSGDHIVEQQVHQLDIVYWFMGKHPEKAIGFGSRQQRLTGDQYDNFSVDYQYDDGRHIHGMCRQMNDCSTAVYEEFRGTKGRTFSSKGKNAVYDLNGNEIMTFDNPDIPPHLQEQRNLITCIRQNIPVNEAERCAIANMAAIMGRVSAYTGKEVSYEEMMNSDMKLGPKSYIMGDLGYVKETRVPVPGTAG